MPKVLLLAFPAVIAAAYSPAASAVGAGMVPCKPIDGSCAHCTDFDYTEDTLSKCVDTSGERQDVWQYWGCWNTNGDIPLPEKCKNQCIPHGDTCVLGYKGVHSPEYCSRQEGEGHHVSCGCETSECSCTTPCMSEPDTPPYAAFFLRAFN